MNVIDLKSRRKQDEPKIDIEKEELYNSTFYELVMNVSKKLTPKQHQLIVTMIVPTLSAKFFEQYKNRSEMLIKSYLLIKPEDKEFLSKMPDTPSALNYIFKYYFNSFQEDLKILTYDETLDKNQDFYFQCETLYRELPCSYVFSVIEIYEQIKELKC